MVNRKIISTPNAPQAKAPLNQAVVANGMVYVSGITPFDLSRQLAPDFADQMHQVMKNLKTILEVANSGLEYIVKSNVYLTDIGNFAEMNEIYASYFDANNYPARTSIEAPMAIPNMLLEIECVAVVAK